MLSITINIEIVYGSPPHKRVENYFGYVPMNGPKRCRYYTINSIDSMRSRMMPECYIASLTGDENPLMLLDDSTDFFESGYIAEQIYLF